MKKILHRVLHAFLLSALLHGTADAQNYLIRGEHPIDSSRITFDDSSLVIHSTTGATTWVDTTGAQLWRIGTTVKPFFSIDDSTRAIMTDTSNPYPVNANDWFTVKIKPGFTNPIIYFKHKYQATAGHDGGIVEFSFDEGNTWDNVKGLCNRDGNGGVGIFTDNFYTQSDTLQNGEMAFTGNSNGWQYSAVQFLFAIPIANKNTASCFNMDTLILLRFRFESDSTADTLDGWIIDDVEMKIDYYAGKVNDVNARKELKIFPNPLQDGIINFPALTNEKDLELRIYNTMGSTLLETGYKHSIRLDKYPPGVYYYTVAGGSQYYSGRFIIE